MALRDCESQVVKAAYTKHGGKKVMWEAKSIIISVSGTFRAWTDLRDLPAVAGDTGGKYLRRAQNRAKKSQ